MASDIEESERFFEFSRFTFDQVNHNLLLDSERVKLSRKAAAILAHLIANRHRWVSRQELKSEFWKDVLVEDGSVDKQVSAVRMALGPDGPSYIETRYKAGWQFVAEGKFRPPVSAASETDQLADGVVDPEPRDLPHEALDAPGLTTAIARPPDVRSSDKYLRLLHDHFVAAAVLALGLLSVVAVFAIKIAPEREPRVIRSTQLTRDGRRKFGPLLTNGGRIFFEEMIGKLRRPVSIPATGGEAVPLPIPFSNASLWDISADGSELFLIVRDRAVYKLWKYSTSTQQLRLFRTGITDASLSPDGRRLATSVGNDLSVSTLDGHLESTKDLPGGVNHIRWSPNGQAIRFALTSFTGATTNSEWELSLRDGQARPLSRIAEGQDYVGASVWSHRGNYFFYEAGTYPELNLWVSRAADWIPAFSAPKPKRLTSGEPGSWNSPATSADDESTVFAMNYYLRCELVRLDKSSRSWSAVWNQIPATELSYSKDGQWVTYVHYPENTIWKARVDGSGHLRLTVPGLEAHQPHWSPDGTRIAYMGKNGKGHWHVFQVSPSGGASEDLTGGDNQGAPAWSPDGRFLIFGERFTKKPRSEMSIHVLDLKSRTLSDMQGTRGLWTPTWSPDGRYIAATTSDQRALHLLAVPGTQWKELVRMRGMENTTWSADSRYVYFDGMQYDGHWSLYRLAIPSGKLEQIAELDDFDYAPEAWFGVDPEGNPLAFRGVRVDEIFKLKCELP